MWEKVVFITPFPKKKCIHIIRCQLHSSLDSAGVGTITYLVAVDIQKNPFFPNLLFLCFLYLYRLSLQLRSKVKALFHFYRSYTMAKEVSSIFHANKIISLFSTYKIIDSEYR